MMARYLVTHSLLSAWLYAMRDNPYEDATTERDPMADFMLTLRREPTPTTAAMQRGIDFENLVTNIVYAHADAGHTWYAAASEIAARVRGGVPQCKARRKVRVGDMDLMLGGRLDWLKAGEIIDVKFTSNYDPGKFFTSTQHPMYFELIPEAHTFTYLVSNGSAVWPETYRRDETPSIIPVISDFMDWLCTVDLMPLYMDKWVTA